MVMLSLATSLDVLADGLSISLLKVSIWKSSLIIGIIALSFTAISIHPGRIVSGI